MKLPQKHKIILVDDHVLLRDALASLINNFENCRVLYSVSNGQELIDKLTGGVYPDIILLDLNMPIMDGYIVAEWLKENKPSIKIIVLTMYDSEVALIRLLQMGVRGFLKKDIHPKDLNDAIISVAENGYYYCNSSTGKLASFFVKNGIGQPAFEKQLLSESEIAFLKLACSDKTYKEIAGELGMSARVIDSYRDGLFEKLDVKSRVGLAIYALKNGLIVF